jgi:hypothetical protein
LSSYFGCKNENRTSTSREKKRVVNLRVLSTKSKTKIENKSGRKQPRPNDIETEIESAPDSIFVNQTPTKVNSQPPTLSSNSKTPFKTPSKSSFVTPKYKKKIRLSPITEEDSINVCSSLKRQETDIHPLPVKTRKISIPSENIIPSEKIPQPLPWVGTLNQSHKKIIMDNKELCSNKILFCSKYVEKTISIY